MAEFDVGTIVAKLTADLSGLQANVNRAKTTLADYERTTGSTLNNASRRFEQYTNYAQSAMSRLSGAVFNLKTAFAALAGSMVIRQFINTADSMTLLESRLKLVTSSSSELAMVQSKLLEISNKTRSSYEATGELYARLGRVTKTLGISQEELLAVTETINKAMIVSGATSAEASAALIQLSQGLASGALRGDELRSVLEQTPRLAQAIAEGMGVTIGQLREFGAQGQLSAETVINALLSQKETIDREFSSIGVTVGQAMTVMGNEIANLIFNLNKSSGATATMGDVIMTLADTIHQFSMSESSKAITIPFERAMEKINELVQYWNTAEGRLKLAEWATKAGHAIATAFDLSLKAAEFLIPKLEEILKIVLAIYGATKGAAIGKMFGPWGTLIGGGIGGLAGYNVTDLLKKMGEESDKTLSGMKKKLEELRKEQEKFKGSMTYEVIGQQIRDLEAQIAEAEKAKKVISETIAEPAKITKKYEPVKLPAPIDKDAMKRAEKIREDFTDKLKKATLSEQEYELWSLDRQYQEYAKTVKNKLELDTWYNAERQKIIEKYAPPERAIVSDVSKYSLDLQILSGNFDEVEKKLIEVAAKNDDLGKSVILTDNSITILDEDYQKLYDTLSKIDAIERHTKSLEQAKNMVLQYGDATDVLYMKLDEFMKIFPELEELVGQDKALDILDKYMESLDKNTKKTEKSIEQMGFAFQSAFEDAIIEGKGFREVLSGLLDDIAKIALRVAITEPLGKWIGGQVAGLDIFGTLGGLFHGGGKVGITPVPIRAYPASMFIGAPRLHDGLMPDEFPAILQRGETVIPKSVTNIAPQQIRIVNVLDPSVVGNYLASSEGEKVIVNIMQKNSRKII